MFGSAAASIIIPGTDKRRACRERAMRCLYDLEAIGHGVHGGRRREKPTFSENYARNRRENEHGRGKKRVSLGPRYTTGENQHAQSVSCVVCTILR